MKLRKKHREGAKLGTSSLPDIIFTLLFFFILIGMVPAPLADIKAEVPVLMGGEDLEETKRYIHVYIGIENAEIVAQIGYDIVVPIAELTTALEEYQEEFPKKDIVVLRIDSETGMGYIRNEIEPAIIKSGIKIVKYQLEDEQN